MYSDGDYQSLYYHSKPENERDVMENILFRMAQSGAKLSYYRSYDEMKENMGLWGTISRAARDLKDFAEDMERATEIMIDAIQNVCTPAELGVEDDGPDLPERLSTSELVKLAEAISDEAIEYSMIRVELRPQINFYNDTFRAPDDAEFAELYRK